MILFHSSITVEKVVVIGRFLGLSAVKQCPGLQAAIAHAFCFLIASLDDINVAVAQRASLYLTTLPDCGLRALCWCLEQQVIKFFHLIVIAYFNDKGHILGISWGFRST